MYSPSILKTIILIPIILVIPGAVVVLYVRERCNADLNLSEIICLSLGISVAISSFVGLVLAELSYFSLTKLSIVLLCLSAIIAVVWFLKKRSISRLGSRSPWWWGVGVILLVIISSFLFIGRFEAILTEADASPYIIEGVSIADHGKIPLENQMLPQLSKEEVEILFGNSEGGEYVSGFLIEDPSTGEVATRYFALYSVVVAISYRMLGLNATLTLMNPFLAVLALLLIVLLIRRLFDGKIALLSGLILAISPLMIWFARYPIPEMYSQLTVFLGLYCFILYYRQGNRYWGLLSALAFSLALTAKFDLYLILFPLAAIIFIMFALRVLKREKYTYLLWFIIPMVLFSTHGWINQKVFNGNYLIGASTAVPSIIKSNALLITIVGLVVLPALVYLFRYLRERGLLNAVLRFVKRYWRPALAILLGALCIFAYLVMPFFKWGAAKTNSWVENARKTFYRLSWYFTHIGLVLFIIGLLLFILYDLNERTLIFFLVCGFGLGTLLYNPLCNPLHMWYLRRFIPLAIPFMGFLIAYALIKVPRLLKWHIVKVIAAAAAITMIVFTSLYTAKIHKVVQYEGALANTKELAARLKGEDKVAIFYGPYAKAYYPDTLRYLFGVNSLPLVLPQGSPEVFTGLFNKLRSQGKDVYLVSTVEEPPEAARDLSFESQEKLGAGFKVLKQEYTWRPEAAIDFNYPIYIRKLQEPISTPSEWYSVNIGENDERVIVSGFYPPQESEGLPYRWTKGTAEFKMPNLKEGKSLTLSIKLGFGGRPGLGEIVPLTVYVENKKVETIKAANRSLGIYQVTFNKALLPDPNAEEINFRIEVPTWSPKEAKGSTDARKLGVTIFQFIIQAGGS